MVRGLLTILLVVVSTLGHTQTPSLQWTKNYGGSNDDIIECIIQTSDGGYAGCGFSMSYTDDLAGGPNSGNFWAFRLDALGNVLWSKRYGGDNGPLSYANRLYGILESSDGGFLLIGAGDSLSLDTIGYHGGEADVVLIKVNVTGEFGWGKYLGGPGSEYGTKLINNFYADNYLIISSTNSNGGDVTGFHDGEEQSRDGWLFNVNDTGGIVWQKCYGGSSSDYLSDILPRENGGYTILGRTNSPNDGDIVGRDLLDTNMLWVINTDSVGNIESQYFPSGSNRFPYSFFRLGEDDFLIMGVSTGTSALPDHHGGTDNFVSRVTNGEVVWSRSYGGTDGEGLFEAIQLGPDRFLLTGVTQSQDGDISNYKGGEGDGWLLCVNANGDIVWQSCYGGSLRDDLYTCLATDSAILVAGFTVSTDGDVLNHYPVNAGFYGSDGWLLKFALPNGIDNVDAINENLRIYPSPTAMGVVYFDASDQFQSLSITVHDAMGRLIACDISRASRNYQISLPALSAPGWYWLRYTGEDGRTVGTGRFLFRP